MQDQNQSNSAAPPIDPRVTWVTMAEAQRAWHIKAKETIIQAYWAGDVLIRKSGRIWTVLIADMITRFGYPKEAIVIDPDQ